MSRRLLAVVGVVLVVVGAVGVMAPTARSVQPRALSVTPSEGLANQVVEVTWTGFTPTTAQGLNSVVLYQCTAQPTSLADCFTDAPFPELPEGTRQLARTAADGTGRSVFEIRPAANLPRLACSESTPCSILAFENDGVPPPAGGLHPTTVIAPLTFARSQADCPPVTNFDVRVDGAASAAPAFYRWAAQLCSATSPLVVDFTETSSTTGRENFLADLVDIGVSSEPVRAEELEAHPERGAFTYAPVTLTAVTVAFNFRDPLTGEPVRDVVLSPRLVARLVTDTNIASFFGDPELRELNPTVRFPSVTNAAPALRAERNAATRMVTSWMANDPATKRFLAGDDDYGVAINPAYEDYPYPRDLFENVAQSSQFLPRAGQRNVALRMFYGVRPAGSTQENPAEIGFMGIVDLPTARRFGLQTARLINPAGEAVAASEESVLAGLQTMARTPAGTLTMDGATADPAAYPLVKVDYALVPDEPASADRGADMAALLTYVAGDGQGVLPPGYVPLTAELRDQTRQVAAALVAPPAPTDVPANPVSAGGGTLGGGFTPGPSSTPRTVRSSGGAAVADAGGDATEVALAADDTDRPALPALATTGDTVVLPLLLLLAGLAFVGWGIGEVKPGLAGAASLGRRAAGRVRGLVGRGGAA